MSAVRMLTDATCEIEMLSSLEPMSRGLMRDTRWGVTHDSSPGHAQPIGSYRRQFDIGVLENLLHTIGYRRVILPQTRSCARQIAKFTNWTGWYKAAFQ